MRKSLTILAAIVVLMAVGTVQADYEVRYFTELTDDGCVKFEDAEYEADVDVWEEACLGEDGAVETDTFVVTATGTIAADITVTVKAGRGKDSQLFDTIPNTGGTVTIHGFTIELTVDGDEYTFTVTSDGEDATAALSYIEFCFGSGATVDDPGDEELVYFDRVEVPD
jgi:hypothetical protein